MQQSMTASTGPTIHLEQQADGTFKQVWTCRFGHVHDDPDYGYTDYLRCECSHRYPLWPIGEDVGDPDWFVCSACGQDFRADRDDLKQNTVEIYLQGADDGESQS